MALELSEVKLELRSCMEIIRILQEEIHLISSSYQPSENKANEDSANKEPNNVQQVVIGLTTHQTEVDIHVSHEETSDNFP